MAPRRRIIIDTDPGVDDILAILFALSAAAEDVEVMLLSVTFGNVEVEHCLRNVVSMFYVISRELAWRRSKGRPEGFGALRACRPVVAVGAEKPLEDQMVMADYFHGNDGLGGVSFSHPHLTPRETWSTLFEAVPTTSDDHVAPPLGQEMAAASTLFIPSQVQSHREILRLLRENEADTITIVAIGPLTNLAIAAAEDPETFLRAQEVIVMGGAVESHGNISPVAEFNTYADSVAAARVFALTSPTPASTFPPPPPPSSMHTLSHPHLPGYPAQLSRPLKLTLFSLDITRPHLLLGDEFQAKVGPLNSQGSPLAEWVHAFLSPTIDKLGSLHEGPPHLSMHDPLCIWYALTSSTRSSQWQLSPGSPEDIRIETAGQWTRGMCVVDRRTRKRHAQTKVEAQRDNEVEMDLPGDSQGWLSDRKGNRIRRMTGSPGAEVFGQVLLDQIFGG
ncbi:MAG: hypothetical protein M1838_002896 [Thelocarpon superellum]|nr:MAG: hypothetical protein M1838_002896 [Thelocarpon superellum]